MKRKIIVNSQSKYYDEVEQRRQTDQGKIVNLFMKSMKKNVMLKKQANEVRREEKRKLRNVTKNERIGKTEDLKKLHNYRKKKIELKM